MSGSTPQVHYHMQSHQPHMHCMGGGMGSGFGRGMMAGMMAGIGGGMASGLMSSLMGFPPFGMGFGRYPGFF